MRRRPLPPVREEVTTKSWSKCCENDLAVYSLVSLVGALTYANSLSGEFVHDDIPAIVTNSDVNGANSVVTGGGNDGCCAAEICGQGRGDTRFPRSLRDCPFPVNVGSLFWHYRVPTYAYPYLFREVYACGLRFEITLEA
ncbi:unnamed protein product [Chilo suppressalis]|uniref:CUB domain-containing protein n=1 Tax=Chilo suppressalis TaxID=168631 RepID=A0ABN8APF7_CHISP|nr:unnamed protein product [Chilo suppressalis]